MQKATITLSFVLITGVIFSQNFTDTIITFKTDTFLCNVTHVNEYSIFYKIKKRKKIKEKIIPRIEVSYLAVKNKKIKIPARKNDSEINDYFIKSNLNKKYEILLLKENTGKSLKIIADSTFITNSTDFFYIATMIQSFAKQYKCKLIYVSDSKNINSDKINIKLYDASDEFYQQVLKSYQKNNIYFVRTNNKMEFKEQSFKINDEKFVLNKNEYHTLNISNTDSIFILKQKGFRTNKEYKKDSLINNEYFYIGHPNYYSDFTARDFGIIIGSVFGGIGGGVLVSVITSSNQTRLNNFVGEFIKLNIDRIKEN